MKIANILFNFKKSENQKKIFGVERCFIDYTSGLISLGNDVITISKPNMVFADEIIGKGGKYFEVNAANVGDVFSILKLAKIFFCFKPDVLICHSGRAMTLSRFALKAIFKKTPIVAIDHGSNSKKFIKADFVLPVNSFFAKKYIKHGKDKNRVLSISNMIEVPKNFRELKKPKFRKKIILGSLGSICYAKFFDKIILAMVILQKKGIECDFVIGGVGPDQEKLKDLAKEFNLSNNFRILGWVDNKREFFSNIDIFILPSFVETFGIVLLEAMLYSTPIISSNSWGPNDIIQDRVNGLKVSKDDAEKMPQLIADAILKLNNDQEFSKKLAKNAYDDFWQKYTSDKVLNNLSHILDNAVKIGVDKG